MSQTAAEAFPAARAAPRVAPGTVLGLVAVAQFMVVLDATVVNVALPTIQRSVGFSEQSLSWVLNAYTLIFGGFLLLADALLKSLLLMLHGREGERVVIRNLFVARLLRLLLILGCRVRLLGLGIHRRRCADHSSGDRDVQRRFTAVVTVHFATWIPRTNLIVADAIGLEHNE